MTEREKAIRECAEVCQIAARAYDMGSGSAHSEEARKVGKAQAVWCEQEIMRLLETA